jgi:hypothetical protein
VLVYGDHEEKLDPSARLIGLEEQRQGLAAFPPGLNTHAALCSLFIDLAGIVQGVADADFAEAGHDRRRPAEAALLDPLKDVAGALLESWESGFGSPVLPPPLVVPPGLPDSVQVRLAEGYAFYALYPESFGLAARRLRLVGPARVIGLRSIGSGLACMVAAALGAPSPITLRPVGHPFARSLLLDAQLAADLLEPGAHYVIVDEGPGLSGSSFGAVLDWLAGHGVPEERIAVLPGHDGELGPQASEKHRARWSRVQRAVVTSDALLERLLPSWIEQLVGPLDEQLQDISGGAWRALVYPDERQWPPVNPMWERRKFLARSGSATWQVRFAGLGASGERRLHIAQQLHAAGLGPEIAGLKHGWLVQRWHEEAPADVPTPDELARYLRWRGTVPAPSFGATLAALVEMARHNVPHVLGNWSPDTERLSGMIRPACIDGRMAAWEWLRLPDGRLLKTDAFDHHQAHDLVGAQDLAWDVAGAIIELGMSPDEASSLALAVDCSPDLLAFYVPAYAGFRIGALRLTADMLGHWPAEAARNGAAADLIEQRLVAWLQRP